MARSDLIKEMIYRNHSPLNFDFWKMQAPPLYSLVSVQDIAYIHNIITHPKYTSKLDYKNDAINYVMRSRGFKKLHAGTNRVVYKHEEIPNIVMKVPFREVALSDGPNEYRNQFDLQPFVTRIFEVSPCGTMALAERVQAITSIPEYLSLYDSIFELLTNKILGKFVLEDIGTKYFKNIGIRDGFGPVLLDFPLMFKLDGQKLYCNKMHLDGSICDGIIDYDEGFNKLICKKCGQRYYAAELAKNEVDNKIIKGFYSKGDSKMEICIRKGRNIVARGGKATETIKSKVLDLEFTGKTESSNNLDNESVDYINNDTIQLPKHDPDIPLPEYLNIPSYGLYKLVSAIEKPEDEFINPPEEGLEIPTKEDYDEDGNFVIENNKETEEPQDTAVENHPVDARMDFEDYENKMSLY